MSQASLPLTVLALAVLAACSSVPNPNARLDQARTDVRMAQADPSARDLAPVELKTASDAVARADAAYERGEPVAAVDHLAYVASQQAAIAQQTGSRRAAEAAVTRATAEREQLRLAARTREADDARRKAEVAQGDTAAAQRQTAIAMRDASDSRQQAAASDRQADASMQQAAASQQQAGDAERRNAALLAQLRDLNAKKTDRGMVITLGDVLFDTNRSVLKPGATRGFEKLAVFLKDNPTRQVLIEGFTDSVGNDGPNQELSARRADAVRSAMVAMGVTGERLSTRGYGEAFPVADNDSSSGRQMNRRVEIIVSDNERIVAPR